MRLRTTSPSYLFQPISGWCTTPDTAPFCSRGSRTLRGGLRLRKLACIAMLISLQTAMMQKRCTMSGTAGTQGLRLARSPCSAPFKKLRRKQDVMVSPRTPHSVLATAKLLYPGSVTALAITLHACMNHPRSKIHQIYANPTAARHSAPGRA